LSLASLVMTTMIIHDNNVQKLQTPLIYAIEKNQSKAFLLLLSYGADLSIKYNGKNALEFARARNKLEFVQLLERHEQLLVLYLIYISDYYFFSSFILLFIQTQQIFT
jgi:ankyrin repeat protein